MTFSNIVYAIHEFEAQNDDEVSLHYGEPIEILQYEDIQYTQGWWQGRNAQGKTGLFPLNYTSFKQSDKGRFNSHESYQHHSRMSSGTSSDSSDGYNTCNLTSPSTADPHYSLDIIPHKTSEKCNSFPSTNQWSVQEVVRWLQTVGLESISQIIIDQEITGDVLINLDHNSLKELGITTYGKRYKIISAITSLKSSMNTGNYPNFPAKNITHSSSLRFESIKHGSITENVSNTNNKDNITSQQLPYLVPPSVTRMKHSASSPALIKREYNKDTFFMTASSIENAQMNDSHISQCSDNSKRSLSSVTRSSTVNSSLKRSTHDALKNAGLSEENSNMFPQKYFENLSEHATALPTSYSNNSTRPEYEGWLYKQSSRYKTWNKRWFVLLGSHLFYLKNQKDIRMRGIIHLQGYRVDLDSTQTSSKKYYFTIQHDRERTFQFYTTDRSEMSHWIQLLMKMTIKRDLFFPVFSSNMVDTVSLKVAQKMKPRPPSLLLYDKNRPHPKIPNKEVTTEDEPGETLLYMENPSTQENDPSFKKLVIQSYPSSSNEQQNILQTEENDFKRDCQSKFSVDNQSSKYDLLQWVNGFLGVNSPEIQDLSSSFRSGEVLIQLLESISGKTIPRCENQTSTSIIMLDNVVEAFKFMGREGVVSTGYTIKDIFIGDEEKVIDMLQSIQAWVKCHRTSQMI